MKMQISPASTDASNFRNLLKHNKKLAACFSWRNYSYASLNEKPCLLLEQDSLALGLSSHHGGKAHLAPDSRLLR